MKLLVLGIVLSFMCPAHSYSIHDPRPVGGAKSSEAEEFRGDNLVRTESDPVAEEAAAAALLAIQEAEEQRKAVEEAEQAAILSEARAALPPIEKQREAFNLFDQDGNNAIDHQDIRDVMNAMGKSRFMEDMGNQIPSGVIDDLLSTVDQDGDGQVTFSDYQGFLLDLAKSPNFANMMQNKEAMPIMGFLSGFESVNEI